jgi:hypothetical protein
MNAETIIFILAIIGWIDLAGGAIVAILAGLFGVSDGSIPRE